MRPADIFTRGPHPAADKVVDSGGARTEVRHIRASDVDAYTRLLRCVDLESGFLAWEPGERTLDEETLRTALARTDSSARLHLVAAHGDEVVAFLVAHRGPTRRLRHRADFTMAVRQGFQRLGIGSRLLEAMDGWAAEHHIDRIELTVMSHNHPAVALYRRAGYHEEGVKRGSIRIDGRPADEIVMAKWLTTARQAWPPAGT